MKPAAVFVYGTLKRGQLRGHMWPCAPREVAPAIARGALFHLGEYPALVAGHDSILGELWRFTAEQMREVLRVLDAIEEFGQGGPNLYLRLVVEVELLTSERAAAFAYFYNQPERLRGLAPLAPGPSGLVSWQGQAAP